jgi:hypothetical protein
VCKEVREYFSLFRDEWSAAFVTNAIARLPAVGVVNMN